MIFNDTIVVLAADAPPGLFPAREQMAVSLGWHIILACFGVAFPMMIFVMYRRAIRRNDPTAFGSGEAVGWCAPACRPSMCPMNMLQPSWPPRQVNSNPASPSLGNVPFNRQTLSDAVRDTHGRLVIAEDHRPEGGLGSAVLEALAAVESTPLRLAHLAVRVMPRSGTPTELLAAAAIDAASIERPASDACWTAPTDHPLATTRPPRRRTTDRWPNREPYPAFPDR
jgi:hypothetical protein